MEYYVAIFFLNINVEALVVLRLSDLQNVLLSEEKQVQNNSPHSLLFVEKGRGGIEAINVLTCIE